MITPSAVRAVTSRHVGDAVRLHDQGVVAGGHEGVGQAGEHAPSVVVDGRGLAVHEGRGGHHGAAVDLADGLVSEAHPEDGDLAGQLADHRHGDAGRSRAAPGPAR